MINKSATKIGTVVFNNGNRNTLYIGANRNTGETIVWQKLEGSRSKRVTGKNIAKLADELDFFLNEGMAHWEGTINHAALDILGSFKKEGPNA